MTARRDERLEAVTPRKIDTPLTSLQAQNRMRLKQMDVPNLRSSTAAERAVNRTASWSGGVSVRVPVFSYQYAGAERELQVQTAALRAELEVAREFFLENSYGTYTFDFRIRSVRLAERKAWRGNLEGISPVYDPSSNELMNPEAFPPEAEYTGWDPFRVWLRDPDEVSLEDNRPHREYVRRFRRNILEAVLEEVEGADPLPGDDDLGLGGLWDWALIPGPRGNVLLASDQIMAAVVRGDFPALKLRGDRSIHRIAMDPTTPWSIHAHELGHLLLGFPDYYNRDVSRERVTQVSAKGYLGEASLMATGAGGGDDAHLDALSKFEVGWLDPLVLVPDFSERLVRLGPVYRDATNALLIHPSPDRKPGEFFLAEVRTSKGKRPDGSPIRFDQKLGPDLEHSLVVYHVNTTDHRPGAPGEGEPLVDVEGEELGDPRIVGLRLGARLELDDTTFYGGAESGLELEVEAASADGVHEVRVRWNFRPRIAATRTHPDDDLHVFVRSEDGSPLYKRGAAGRWRPSKEGWSDLGGSITHTPGVTRAERELLVTVRGRSGRPFHKRRDARGRWSPTGAWERLGGRVTGSPAMTKRVFQEVVVRGVSGNAFHKSGDGEGGWRPGDRAWRDIGGPITGTPAVGVVHKRVVVFARRHDGTPIYKWRGPGGWMPGRQEWAELPGRISADPSAVGQRTVLYLAVRGVSGQTFVMHFGGDLRRPSDWVNLGGQALGAPACAFAHGSAWVAVTGTSGAVFIKRGREDSWDRGWTSLGGRVVDAPAVVGKGDRLDVFVTGVSGRVFRKHFDGRRWSHDWESLGGRIL